MGRKKYTKPEEVRDHILTIRLTSAEAEIIDKFCRGRNKSKSQLCRHLLLKLAETYWVELK